MADTEALNVFEAFHKPCVHNGDYYELRPQYTSLTYSIVQYEICDEAGKCISKGEFRTNTDKNQSHSEILVLERLNKELEKKSQLQPKRIVIEITNSFSPCEVCSMKLVDFKREQEQKGLEVDMQMVFAALFNINRHSCFQSFCKEGTCYKHVAHSWDTTGKSGEALRRVQQYQKYSVENQQGLREMNTAGIKLDTFKPSTWDFLRSFLKVNQPNDEMREREDERMSRDLQSILATEDKGAAAAAGFD